MSSKKGKSLRCQVSIGVKPGSSKKEGEIFLMICSRQDRNGNKYLIKGNVQQVFTKFVNEGKATIRFLQPPNDVCLSKSDPVQLKGLLMVLKKALQGEEFDSTTLSTLAPASTKQVERLKTRLTIESRKDYPVTQGFPSGLSYLKITGCSLRRFDSRVLQLSNLVTLDLSNNHIHTLPDNFDAVPSLSQLLLNDNHIQDIAKTFCTSSLSKSLAVLDLSKNRLRFVWPCISDLKMLVTLKLDSNEIERLPENIGALDNLQTFTATNNKLQVLPGSFFKLRMNSLDLFGNPFPKAIGGWMSEPTKEQTCTLFEIAARAVKKLRLPYTLEDVPGQVYEMLNNAKICFCGQYCVSAFGKYGIDMDLHVVASTVTSVDTEGKVTAPTTGYLCSTACGALVRRKSLSVKKLPGH